MLLPSTRFGLGSSMYGAWKNAEDLTLDDELWLLDKRNKSIFSLDLEPQDQPVKVYNFEVADWHNYFVGMWMMLVHNSGDCGEGALKGVDDIIKSPSLLEGRSLSDVQSILKNTTGWAEGTLKKGRSAGDGWTLRQLNSRGTDFTDLYIQYSPGSSRHFGGKPYWKVSSGNGGVQWFLAG